MDRALVTGASGYVGSRLMRELHARGVPVGCIARDPSRVGGRVQSPGRFVDHDTPLFTAEISSAIFTLLPSSAPPVSSA